MNRLSDCYFMPNEKLFSYIMAKTSYIQWDDHDVRFVLDQHNELDFHSANSLQQQSNDRHVAPLGHIILILSQPIFRIHGKGDHSVVDEQSTNVIFKVREIT
jgi:hypothetical protein